MSQKPELVIDDLHVAVTFKDTNVAGAPVNGIRSYQVAAVEPGIQQGPDGIITIDLARPVRVTAFTLAHTVTLTLSVLNVVRLPSSVVEPMIAGSIVFVAATNVFWPERSRGWSTRR